MLIDQKNNIIQIEPRDINYFLIAYIRQYLFYTRNAEIKGIVFPMFQSVPHPDTEESVPVEWIPETDPVAVSIVEDGSNVPEVTPAQEAEADAKDDRLKEIKGELSASLIESVAKEAESPKAYPKPAAKKSPLPDRQPNMPPGGDIGPGVSPSNMGNRDSKLDRQIRQDLRDEPGVDESKEVEAEIEKPKQ